MEGYTVKISESSIELSAKDRIRMKDTSNANSIDEMTQSEPLVISFSYYAVLQIHNDKSDSKDYTKVVVVDKDGNKFVTGSSSFIEALRNIVEEMADAGETDYEIEIYRKPSKNFKGKEFITCSIV